MELKEIGLLIQKRRKFLNLKQSDLAELSNTNMRTIHLVEQGTGNPSFETLKGILEVLGFEVQIKIKQVG
jgi:transcriptional regulator with XRE-family HTH domain